MSVERYLKEKCSELQEEVHSLKSGMSQKVSTFLHDKKGKKTHEMLCYNYIHFKLYCEKQNDFQFQMVQLLKMKAYLHQNEA